MNITKARVDNFIQIWRDGRWKDSIIETQSQANFVNDFSDDIYRPIELSDYWVRKLGFIAFAKDIDGYIYYGIDGFYIESQNSGYDYNVMTNIQSVHELQNLHADQTGKTLKEL